MNSLKDYQPLLFEEIHPEENQRFSRVNTIHSKLRLLHEELNTYLAARPEERPQIHSPIDAVNVLQYFMGHLLQEELWVLNLDIRNRIMNLGRVYRGTVSSSTVRLAEIYREAVIANSPAIIIAHNHPSGDTSPSPEDIQLTRSAVQAAGLLGIDLLDHLIISNFNFTSLREKKLGF